MKNLILVEDNNGEQWEDYRNWIEHAYFVDTDKSAITLENEWKAHVVSCMESANLTVNPHWLNIMVNSAVKSKKLHKKILSENKFTDWLVKTYSAEPVKFDTVRHVNTK